MILCPTVFFAQTSTLEFKNSKTALATVQKYVKALQNGDVATMNAQFASDAVIYNLGGAVDSTSVAGHGEYYTRSTNTYNHKFARDFYLPVKVTDYWNEGEWVLSWGTNVVTSKKEGAQISVPFHTAAMIENGKIKRLYYFYDMLNILKNQGFTIQPPSK
ncbi:nuclear transport factor 2 family protein [Flavobacteriaceae bacterium R33]|uniref:Nuclear transport factor 2 family protein n=1 Tax=Poritiphilus flavus TaxID=2697053 RepID=A0A6L9EBE4_9FLAO|nr:nuclear transport factor 2 family protein [Poritiphilus flavus]